MVAGPAHVPLGEALPLPALRQSLDAMLKRNRDGSAAAQAERRRQLGRLLKDFDKLGHAGIAPPSAARKITREHLLALARLWQEEGLAASTQRTRKAALGWWCKRLHRDWRFPSPDPPPVVEERRLFFGEPVATSLAIRRLSDIAATIDQRQVKAALRLQRAFGLTIEESIKLRPAAAQNGPQDRVILSAAWTRARKERWVPRECRHWAPRDRRLWAPRNALSAAAAAASTTPHGSLIPSGWSYVNWLAEFERLLAVAGIDPRLGQRPAYAWTRYHEMSGRHAPCLGGPPEPASTRGNFREWIGREMGVSPSIVSEYLRVGAAAY